ncbi:hypothetical protein FisN_18Hh273 [Fistulifera solaris]|uniref:Oxidation resistance protein 1 n=1 Tax=Fistulifera solaris TaxID=1519565 RepID=A0A1Z5KIW7_FISSO|nr:hypothetical protein FisN_18Hh273 [Fistulifera solaris]|eukprot:GAX26157.1 hypothetical protein FisN_18Hh273 [Fistulifera solaris]
MGGVLTSPENLGVWNSMYFANDALHRNKRKQSCDGKEYFTCICFLSAIVPFLYRQMGVSSSTANHSRTPEQLDVQFLGERCPFGDAELWHLYRCYQAWQSQTSKTTFLKDWAGACWNRRSKLPHTEAKEDDSSTQQTMALEEYVEKIAQVEREVLPVDFGNRLYQRAFTISENAYGTQPPESSTSRDHLEAFFEGLSNASRRGSRAALQVMFRNCQATKNENNEVTIQATEFIQLGYRLALTSEFLQGNHASIPVINDTQQHDETLLALAQSIVEQRKKRMTYIQTDSTTNSTDDFAVTFEDILEWSEAVAPTFASILPTLFHTILFPGMSHSSTGRTAYEFPWVTDDSKPSSFFQNPTSSLLFTFGCLSPALGGSYYCLYTSTQDGLSFNRLQNALLGYSGPTLLLARTTGKKGSILGAFTASPWKESKDFYGNTDCFLFQVAPRTSIFRPSGSDRNFMYCNSYARSKGYDQQAHGIGFGGTTTEPRLFFPESFEQCIAGSRDLTFAHGQLLPDGQRFFELDSLEVWGVGGSEVVAAALGAQHQARAIKAENLRKARTVDRAQFLDDFQSGVIESKAFAHRNQVDHGRAGTYDEAKK